MRLTFPLSLLPSLSPSALRKLTSILALRTPYAYSFTVRRLGPSPPLPPRPRKPRPPLLRREPAAERALLALVAATPAVESPRLLRSLMLRWLTTSAPMPPLPKALPPSTALSPRPAPARTSAWLTRSPKWPNDCFHFPPSRLLHDTSSANILRSSLWLMRGSYLLLCSFFSLAVFLYSFYLFLLLVPAGLILSCLSQKPVEESMYLHSQWDITNDNRFRTILESL